MANIGAFSQGFTAGFNLVDAAFARRAQARQNERIFQENQRRWDVQNARAAAQEQRVATQFEQQQAQYMEQQAANQLWSQASQGDAKSMLQSPQVIAAIRARVEDGTGTTLDRVEVNDDGTVTPIVSGTYADGTPFTNMPITHGGVPMANDGEPITLDATDLYNISIASFPQSTQGQMAMVDAAYQRQFGGGQQTAPAQGGAQPPGTVQTVPQTQEPLQAAAPEPGHDLAVFPIAVPSIAGPGGILAVVILTDNNRYSLGEQDVTALMLGLVLAITLLVMLLANRIHRVIGDTGANVMIRVMGLLLCSLAAEQIVEGVFELIAAAPSA